MCAISAGGATTCIFLSNFQTASRWPHVAKTEISLGGIPVTCEEALAAVELLNASRASAIRSILMAARNPLADCDYHAVYRPGLAAARAAVARKEGRNIGPKGRHLAKWAFAQAIRQKVAEAACQALQQVLESFAADERYASAIATDAVTLLQRAGHRRGAVMIRDSDSGQGTDSLAA